MITKINHPTWHTIIYTKNLYQIKVLLRSEVDIDSQDNHGFTLMHLAAQLGNLELIKLFRDHKANCNLENRHGELPLHLACQNGHLKVTSVLLKITSDINIQDRYGNTSLHIASANGYIAIVKILLKSNAIINRVNERGMTALALAEYHNHQAIIALLKQYGGRKIMGNFEAIKSSYINTHFARKFSISMFSLFTIGFSIIATIATSGEFALTILESIGASCGMSIVCLEKPYHTLRMLERYNFNYGCINFI